MCDKYMTAVEVLHEYYFTFLIRLITLVILFKFPMLCRRLQHPNLVKLYGICTSCSPIRIVTEFMKNGNYLAASL